jgi:hypothetical protein
VVLDGAPNHRCGDLVLPDNISLLFLPAKMNNIRISWHDAARSAAAMLSVLVAVPQSFAQSDYEPLPPITVHPQPYYPLPPNPLDVLARS